MNTLKNKPELQFIFFVGVIISLVVISVWPQPTIVNTTVETECKEDSLQMVINELQSEIEIDEDGWDDKEKRYEQIIFEYQYGLDHLKYYHPEAYKEFHRIIGYKQEYSRETERENKKRLKTIGKW
jgi:hypothetical protein